MQSGRVDLPCEADVDCELTSNLYNNVGTGPINTDNVSQVVLGRHKPGHASIPDPLGGLARKCHHGNCTSALDTLLHDPTNQTGSGVSSSDKPRAGNAEV